VSGPYFRLVLGVIAAVWTLEAAAQDHRGFGSAAGADTQADGPSDFPALSNDTLSYVADPAESYVVEGTTSNADESEPAPARQTTQRAAQQASSECRAYYPAGPADDRSGTVCERSDGSLRVVAAPAARPPFAVTAPRTAQYCREYQQVVSTGGYPRVGYGKACWQADGSWQIVTAPAIIETPQMSARAVAAPRTPPQRSTSSNYRPAEGRLRLPEFYFGNLFGWLPGVRRDNSKYNSRGRYDD
jgi:surface antigen